MKGAKGSRSPGGQLYDRLLFPRIENYALNNDYTDVEEVTDYLRRNYKEYTRHKLGPFKNQVARAIETITRRGGVVKPEIRLQVPSPQPHACLPGTVRGACQLMP
jgi:ribosome biogenesis ATPase